MLEIEISMTSMLEIQVGVKTGGGEVHHVVPKRTQSNYRILRTSIFDLVIEVKLFWEILC